MQQRVLVCGGRDYADRQTLYAVLDVAHEANPISVLITGMARGADQLGYDWAVSHIIAVAPFPADWRTHGRKAGPIRNQQMLDEGRPHLVIAFPGGVGTADMISSAEAVDIPVVRVKKKS